MENTIESIVKMAQSASKSFGTPLADNLEQGLLSNGFKIAPINPTNKMLKAAAKAMLNENRPTKRRVSNKVKHRIRYQAMLAVV